MDCNGRYGKRVYPMLESDKIFGKTFAAEEE